MSTGLWDHLDSWEVGPGRDWLGSEAREIRKFISNPPKLSKITVTFQVPPPRAAAANGFLRRQSKVVQKLPGNDAGLPSELDLVSVAADNAHLLQLLQDILAVASGSLDNDSAELKPRDALDHICNLIREDIDDQERSAGGQILTALYNMREAVLERSVDVAAELIKKLDDTEQGHA